MDIPQDLREFLKDPNNRILTLPRGGEIQRVIFNSLEELTLSRFTVDGWELHNMGHLAKDPEEEREFEGINLVKQCNDYSPDGVLVWFPSFKQYGSADTGHGCILTYPGVTWTHLISDPLWYVNGQWYPEKVTHRVINPWHDELGEA